MTRRKQIEQRRAINRAIAERDAKARCPICKRALPPICACCFSALDEQPYCSEDCVGIAEERAKAIVL